MAPAHSSGADRPPYSAILIDGHELHNGWRWAGAHATPDPSGLRGEGRPVRHTAVRLVQEQRSVEVVLHTRVDGSQFMVRWLEITNTGSTPTAIGALAPWSGLVWNHRADPGRDYRVTFDNAAETVSFRGVELARDGVRVCLPANLTSELLLIEAA